MTRNPIPYLPPRQGTPWPSSPQGDTRTHRCWHRTGCFREKIRSTEPLVDHHTAERTLLDHETHTCQCHRPTRFRLEMESKCYDGSVQHRPRSQKVLTRPLEMKRGERPPTYAPLARSHHYPRAEKPDSHHILGHRAPSWRVRHQMQTTHHTHNACSCRPCPATCATAYR